MVDTLTEWRCNSCEATYNDTNFNDVYFHQCPKGTVDPRNENVDENGDIKAAGKGRTET